jgi:Flp pilus assembly protein TadG
MLDSKRISPRHPASSVWASFCRLASGESDGIRGVSAIEFAIIAPVFLIALIGTIDIGLGFYRQMQVQNAAQVGAQYAALHGFDGTDIANAITSATAYSAITASPAPSKFCGCVSTSGVNVVDCASSWPGGAAAGSYVTASAQATYNTVLPYPLIPSSYTLSAASILRIQ